MPDGCLSFVEFDRLFLYVMNPLLDDLPDLRVGFSGSVGEGLCAQPI